MNKIQLKALGKINLGLDVLKRREDGYHEVKMIMQTVSLCDELELKKSWKEGIKVQTNLYYHSVKEEDTCVGGYGRREFRCGSRFVGHEPDVWAGTFLQGPDGTGREAGCGCTLLYFKRDRVGGRDRRKTYSASAHAEMLFADCQARG